MDYLKGNKAIENPECTCLNCLKETKLHTIEINQMGYDSKFDGLSTKIQLCDECYKLTNPDWWKLEIVSNKELGDDFSKYKYENEIFEFINQMPIAGQELFFNYFASGASANYNIESQDWIDYELGVLSDDKCKEYGLNI